MGIDEPKTAGRIDSVSYKTKVVFIAGLLAALPAAGCTTDEAPTEDELAGESELDGEPGALGKADHEGSTFTFYQVEYDMRRCVSPLCGGYWVSRVNRAFTQCVDGSWAQRCYVAGADLSGTGFPEAQQGTVRSELGSGKALVRASITERTYEGFGTLGELAVTEVWLANSATPADGLFVKVSDSGLRCITAPCFNTFRETKINSYLYADFSELDLESTDATPEEQATAFTNIYEDGLIVAGYRYYFYQQGWQKGRWATQLYQRIQPEVAKDCFVGGCSSQLCSDQEGAISTCEWRAEYACYREATCERQANDKCGWTETPELTACLADPPPL